MAVIMMAVSPVLPAMSLVTLAKFWILLLVAVIHINLNRLAKIGMSMTAHPYFFYADSSAGIG
jgi:hypothetical protein